VGIEQPKDVLVPPLAELKSKGIAPKENLLKHLKDGIFELRVRFENRIARSFFFYEAAKRREPSLSRRGCPGMDHPY
jgi:hypothetical protein